LEDFDDIISVIGKRRWTPRECDIVVQRLIADLEANPSEDLADRIHELYYEGGLTQREVADALGLSRGKVQNVFRKMGWTGRHVEKIIDPDEVCRLYDKEQMTQQEIATKLGVSRSYIYKTLREHRGSNYTRKSRQMDIDLETAHRLYCIEGLSQDAVAEKLGVSQSMISDRMRELGWKRKGSESVSIDVDELHQLYYEDGMSQQAVADHLGFSLKYIRRKFKELGWRAGPRGAILDIDEVLQLRFIDELDTIEIARRVGVSCGRIEKLIKDVDWDTGYELSGTSSSRNKHGSNAYRIEGRMLREKVFGTECNICNASSEKRMLSVHRKDGTPHTTEDLWNPEILKTLNYSDWSLLCPHCHHATHWAMKFLAMEWDVIERLANRDINANSRQIDSNKSLTDYSSEIEFRIRKGEIRQLRFDIFGDECGICGRHADDSKLILHRKDGTKHHRKSTWTRKFVSYADANEWVMLCVRCHNGTHWLMKQLDMSWESIESNLHSKSLRVSGSQE
ncbi:MAG: hypothetical protein ACFFET_19085, partial [Candidatus Thorarchaeota archaeon]